MTIPAHEAMAESAQFASYPSLRGRTVLVTGGASGIGESVVRAFAHQHAQVVFLDIQDDCAAKLIEDLAGEGLPRPVYIRCDLADAGALEAAMLQVTAQFPSIDVLVNNAGNDTRHSLDDVTAEFWDTCMAINLRQQFFMSKAVIPSMQRQGRGSIINLSSIAWVIPSTDLPVYVTAKAGIVGMARTLAHKFGADNIRVNCLLPGAIQTERQKRLWLTEEYRAEILSRQALKRMLEPEEVARLILFLAADDSSAITGQSYVIDGGWV